MTTPMQIVRPLDIIGGGLLTDSNVAEPDTTITPAEVVWNAGTAYAIGDRAIRTTTHKLYERLVAGTTATFPENDPINWVEVSYTNKYRMFDQVNSSQTTQATEIDVTITPNRVINSIGILNVDAQTIQVIVDDTIDGVVYDETFSMQAPPELALWWNYFFDPIEYVDNLYANLPSYGSSSTVQVIVTNAGDAAVGTLILGPAIAVGKGVHYGARLGLRDFSGKERNTFGDLVLIERSYSERNNYTMLVPTMQRASVAKLLKVNRARPMLFIGVAGQEDTYVYGIYKDFEFIIDFEEDSVLSIEIEGLT